MQILSIEPKDLYDVLQDKGSELYLLDVREPDEHQRVKIEASTLVPLQQVPSRLEEIRLAAASARVAVVYCRSGGRSETAIRWLEEQGVVGLRNLRGGINAYAKEADTSLEPY